MIKVRTQEWPRSLHQLPPPVIRGLVARGLASFRGRAARTCVSEQRAVLVRRMAGEASNEVAASFAFAVYGVDRGEAETDRRIETTLDAQIRDGLLEEIAELDRRYRLVEQARRPDRRRNMASQTHGYREFVRVAASTGKAIAEPDGADIAAARAEALGHIWAYSRRQRSWLRSSDGSRSDHRLSVDLAAWRRTGTNERALGHPGLHRCQTRVETGRDAQTRGASVLEFTAIRA